MFIIKQMTIQELLGEIGFKYMINTGYVYNQYRVLLFTNGDVDIRVNGFSIYYHTGFHHIFVNNYLEKLFKKELRKYKIKCLLSK